MDPSAVLPGQGQTLGVPEGPVDAFGGGFVCFGPAGWGVGFGGFDAGGFLDGGRCFGGFFGRLGGFVFAGFRAQSRIGVVVVTACFDHGSGSRVLCV